MSGDWQPNAAELLIVFLIYVGIGLPLGIPPGENLEVANILPESSFYAVTWAGIAPETASPDSPRQPLSDLINNPEFSRIATNLQQQLAGKFSLWEGLLEEPWTVEAARLLREYGDDILKSPAALFIEDIVPPVDGEREWRIDAGFASFLPNAAGSLTRDLARLESAINSDPRKLLLATPIRTEDATGGRITSKILGLPPISWIISDGYFVIGVGHVDAVDLRPRIRGQAPNWFQSAQQRSEDIQLCTLSRVDLGRILATFLPKFTSLPTAIRNELLEAKLGTYTVTSGLDQERCVVRSQLDLGHIPFQWQSLEQPPLTLSDLEGIPADATYALAMKASLRQFWESAVLLAGISNGDLHFGDTVVEAARSQWGFDLRNDFLNCFGSTLYAYHSPAESGNILAGPTISLEINEPEKLKSTLETIAARLKPSGNPDRYAPTITSVRSGDVDVYSLHDSDSQYPFSISWCLVDNHLFVALFPQNLRSKLHLAENGERLAARSDLMPDFNSERRVVSYWYADTVKIADSIVPLLPWLKSLPAWSLGLEENVRPVDTTNLPAIALIRPYLRPSTGWMVYHSKGIEIEQKLGVPASGSIASLPVAAATLLPSIHHANIQAKYASSLGKLRTICNAVIAYQEDKGRLPPLYEMTRDGKPGLSWRVLVLPYLEQKGLYDRFQLAEPWDSPNNRPLISLMPDVYRSNISKSPMDHTNFLAIAGENTVWTLPEKPITITDVVDGEGMTLLAVEVDDDRAVLWSRPQEFEWQPENPTAGLGKLLRTNAFHAVFLDADATAISLVTDRPVIRAIFTRNGNEDFDYGDVVKP
jgi:Protein of unknown function (DUF1559)